MRGSLNERLQYRLNRMLARGSLLPYVLLGGLSVVATALGMNAWYFGLYSEAGLAASGIDGDLGRGFVDALMWSLKHVIDPGAFGEDYGAPLPVIVISLIVSVIGLGIFGTLIAIISNSVQQRLEAVRLGNTPVFERGHTVVLGWSNKLAQVLRFLSQSRQSGTVAVLAPRDIQSMAIALRSRDELHNIDVVLRSGSTSSLPDLSRMAIERAAQIIVLSPTGVSGAPAKPDVDTIKTLMLLKAFKGWQGTPPHIVSEIDERQHAEIANMAGGSGVSILSSSDIVSRLIVQSAREPGVSRVYEEIFSSRGSGVNVEMVAAAAAARFGDVAHWFPNAIPLGVSWTETTGGQQRSAAGLNPEPDYEIGEDECLILLHAGDQAVADSARQASPPAAVTTRQRHRSCLSTVCVLGWNDNVDEILSELDAHLPRGATVTIIADMPEPQMAAHVERYAPRGFRNLDLTLKRGDLVDRATLKAEQVLDHDCIVALADYGPRAEDPDSRVILQLLLLTDIHKASQSARRPHVVAELLDPRSRELTEHTLARDVVVSTEIISAQLAQVACTPVLGPIYRELLSAGGIEIVLRPASDYLTECSSCRFESIVSAAQGFGETALGLMNGDGVTRLNPSKTELLRIDAGSRVIAMAQQMYI